MKSGWQIKTLVDITNLITCGVAKRPDYVDNGIPFLSARNVKNGQVIWNNYRYISEETHTQLTKNNKPRKGDILYTRVGSFGEAAIVEENTEFSIFVSLTLIKTKDEILNSFLRYYLNSYEVKTLAKNSISGSGVGNLNVGTVRDFLIPVPPIHEQKRIVSIVDEVFEGIDRAIANTEKNLTNARELFESYLNEIFTQQSSNWEAKRLGDISEVQSGGTPSRSKSDYWGGHLAWYSSGELNELYTTSPERNIINEGLANSNSKLFPKGSLLIRMYDTAALKMSILDREAAFNQAIAGVKPNNKIDLVFILHAINFMKPEILSLRRGVRQKNLSLQKIKDIVLVIPELQKQQRVVQELASVKKETQYLEAIYRKKLAALNELKQSILQKAFTGEFTADTANQAIEAAEQDRPISKDCLRSAETTKQNVHQSGQLSLWA
jgi:type I restriction enzyme, S subunit